MRGLFDVGIVSKIYDIAKEYKKVPGLHRNVVVNNPFTSYCLSVYSEEILEKLKVGDMIYFQAEPFMVWNKLTSNHLEFKPGYHLKLVDYVMIDVDLFNSIMES